MAARKTRAKPPTQHLISTSPKRVVCSCGTAVLSCLVDGTRRRIDTYRINQTGEAMALIAGAKTYAMNVIGRDHLYPRSAAHITRGLPEYGHIHPEHQCGVSWNRPEYLDGRAIFPVAYTGTTPPF